jgi:hypothetical protein
MKKKKSRPIPFVPRKSHEKSLTVNPKNPNPKSIAPFPVYKEKKANPNVPKMTDSSKNSP